MHHLTVRRTTLRSLAAAALALASVLAVGLSAPGVATQDTQEGPGAPAQRVSASQVAAATPGDFTGYGFDQCLTPTQASMDKWRKHSPFSAVGIYVSGDSRACRVQPNLTPDWVANQVAKGWRLLPIALGPQASCEKRFPRYEDDFTISPAPASDYAAARAQGVVEADKNVADSAALGIGAGSTLWYDLEAFDMKNTHCRESALRFVSSWTGRVRELGYVAGFYSSASSGILMLDQARTQRPGQFNLPDRIWIARWDGTADTSTTYITDEGWNPGGRMKQYRGGHDETWGGVRINIDSNWIDLGAGSRPTAAANCGGIKLAYWKYAQLSPTKAPASRVKVLQCLLSQQGAYAGAIDGVYDADTIASAQAWQAGRKFTPTTTWQKRHWVALHAAGANTPAKRGSTGEHVHRLQRALNATGVAQFRANGVFNAKTESALVAYQRKRGLVAAGVATPQTWNSLRQGKF